MYERSFFSIRRKQAKSRIVAEKDDFIGRQSIIIRMCSSIGFVEDGFFIILDGTEDSIKKAKELLAGLASQYKDNEAVLKKHDELEEQATHGFGFIMG